MHFSIFSPNSNSPAKCPNRLGTLPAFRTYAMQYRYICGQTQIVVLKNSICYIDVPTVPLLSSGRTRSWSGHPFGPRFASTMEHVFYYHFYYSDICCKYIYIDTSYIYNFGLCTRFLSHCFLQTEGKHHQFMWANCPVKTKGLAWWKSRFDVWPILKMVQTTSSLRIGAYNTKFCWYLENDWSFVCHVIDVQSFNFTSATDLKNAPGQRQMQQKILAKRWPLWQREKIMMGPTVE